MFFVFQTQVLLLKDPLLMSSVVALFGSGKQRSYSS